MLLFQLETDFGWRYRTSWPADPFRNPHPGPYWTVQPASQLHSFVFFSSLKHATFSVEPLPHSLAPSYELIGNYNSIPTLFRKYRVQPSSFFFQSFLTFFSRFLFWLHVDGCFAVWNSRELSPVRRRALDLLPRRNRSSPSPSPIPLSSAMASKPTSPTASSPKYFNCSFDHSSFLSYRVIYYCLFSFTFGFEICCWI